MFAFRALVGGLHMDAHCPDLSYCRDVHLDIAKTVAELLATLIITALL